MHKRSFFLAVETMWADTVVKWSDVVLTLNVLRVQFGKISDRSVKGTGLQECNRQKGLKTMA